MGDDLVRRRRAVLAQVLGRVRVADQRHVVAADEGAMEGGADALVGLGAGHDQAPDAGLGEDLLEVGVLEGVAVALVHERLGVLACELRDVLPARRCPSPGRSSECCTHTTGTSSVAGLVDQRADVGDDRVAVVGVGHDAVLDVDDHQGGVGTVWQYGHGGLLCGSGGPSDATADLRQTQPSTLVLRYQRRQELGRHPLLDGRPGAWAQLGDVHYSPFPPSALGPSPLHQQPRPWLDAVDGNRDPAMTTRVGCRTVGTIGPRGMPGPHAVAQRYAADPSAVSAARHVTTLEHMSYVA